MQKKVSTLFYFLNTKKTTEPAAAAADHLSPCKHDTFLKLLWLSALPGEQNVIKCSVPAQYANSSPLSDRDNADGLQMTAETITSARGRHPLAVGD